MKKYRYDIIFPDGRIKSIYQIPDENGFIKESLSDLFEKETGKELSSKAPSIAELGYKLLYIGIEE